MENSKERTFGNVVTENAIDIDGYNKVNPTSADITITTGTNEHTFYYTKRNDLSYTVNYLEKDTNNVLHDAKTVENKTFEEEDKCPICGCPGNKFMEY